MSLAFLLLWAMLAASVGLSLVSAFETYLGLVNFMPVGVLGAVFAGIFTLAVQALLFVISWRIAQHLLDPIRSQTPSFLIWVICACFSGYFSYFGFFQQAGGRDENVRVDAVVATQSEVLRSIRTDIESDLNRSFQNEFLQGANYEPWITGLSDLIAKAEAIQPEIEVKALEREQDLTKELNILRQRLDGLQNKLADAEAAVRIADGRRSTLQSEVESLMDEIASLRIEMDDAQTEVSALKAQLEIEERTGKGPRYNKITIDLGSANARLANVSKQLATLEPRLAERLQEKTREDIAAENNIEQNKVNTILSDIDNVEARINAAQIAIDDTRSAANTNFSTERQAFDQAVAQLRNQDYAAYDQLVGRCQSTVRQITEAGLGNQVNGTQCSYPDLSPIIASMRERSKKLGEFEEICVRNRARVVRSDVGAPKLDGVITQLQNQCAPFVVSTDVNNSVNRTLSRLRTERGDEAIVFSQASVALLTDGQSNAVIATIFAVIVDLLVLLCALVGRNVGIPETARAIDRIQARLEIPNDQFEEGYERRLVLPEESNERSLIEPVLLQLMSDELAVQKPGEDNQVILFKHGSMARLKKMRGDVVRGAANEAAATPIAQPPINRSARRRF